MEITAGTACTMHRKGSPQMFSLLPSYLFRSEMGLLTRPVGRVTVEFGILIIFIIISEV